MLVNFSHTPIPFTSHENTPFNKNVKTSKRRTLSNKYYCYTYAFNINYSAIFGHQFHTSNKWILLKNPFHLEYRTTGPSPVEQFDDKRPRVLNIWKLHILSRLRSTRRNNMEKILTLFNRNNCI